MDIAASGRVFISYRREETRHLAGRLADRIAVQFGKNHVFMDVDTIDPGADFVAAIVKAVSSCDVLLAMIGPAWLGIEDGRGNRRLDNPHDFVAQEIGTALQREILVIPILVDGAEMPRIDDLPANLGGLARRNAVRLDHETFSSDVQRIIDSVERARRSNPFGPDSERPTPVTQRLPVQNVTPHTNLRVGPAPKAPWTDAAFQRTAGSASLVGHAERETKTRLRPELLKRINYLSTLRITLWWAIFAYTPIFGSCFGLGLRTLSPNVAGSIFALTLLTTIFAALVFAVNKVVQRQRALASTAVPRQSVPNTRLRQSYINKLYICIAAIWFLFLLLFFFSPTAATIG